MRCRHNRAWPTIYGRCIGFLWCPDCGARREIKMSDDGCAFYPSEKYWVKPGTADKDMERNRQHPNVEEER